ncbi:MAG: alpha/beta hydrolase [Flavobacteriaceae bacterium]|nr:alpha/beta hydrolase [Flavobacteriaceae bacterium]
MNTYKKLFVISLVSILVVSSCKEKKKDTTPLTVKTTGKEVSFYAKDSMKVVGDLYEQNKSQPIILLFHQARSNAKGEYSTIIPKLTAKGFNVLAIDQRSGGQLFGNYNRTLAGSTYKNYSYCEAYPDLEAALLYISKQGYQGKKIVWGSSYSAALAIKLAHNHQNKIHGVLAFSPASGGPMKDCNADNLLKTLKTPLLLLRPSKEMGIESVKKQFNLATEFNHQTYIAKDGVHGSSMLVAVRTKTAVDDTWNKVFRFLETFK